jgi:hypothetical protein
MNEMRAKLAGSQAYNCNVNGDDVQHIWCLGSEVNESPEVVLERFLVILLTRQKITLCKLSGVGNPESWRGSTASNRPVHESHQDS